MWLFTNFGFFSVVQKPGTPFLTVRARVKADLERLRERYLHELGPTEGKKGTDYPWRATVPHASLAAAIGKIVMDCHYANFKDEVKVKQGNERAHRYAKVWDALYGMAEEAVSKSQTSGKVEQFAQSAKTTPSGLNAAYGGVVFDAEGRVLLREPANHFDNYVWTFAKGKPDKGETPEEAALREVLEETGIKASILAPIPGDFLGGTTVNRYFLMVPDGEVPLSTPDKETASIQWAHPDAARTLIEQTTNLKGRTRDLAVLEAGVKAWGDHQGGQV